MHPQGFFDRLTRLYWLANHMQSPSRALSMAASEELKGRTALSQAGHQVSGRHHSGGRRGKGFKETLYGTNNPEKQGTLDRRI
jgi:hypothetical protein